jgi:nickel transport protein
MPEKWLWWTKTLMALWIHGVCMSLAIGIFSTPALAHRILVFAFVEGDFIRTESKFIPDTPVHQGKVEVLDKKNGKVLLTGQTDNQGKFSFKIPPEAVAQKLDLEIVTEAAMGHRGSWLLKANSYLTGATPEKAADPAPASATVPAAPGILHLNQQELDAALDKALERQLAPIKETLGKMSAHRTSPADIIGGLGYLMGIFGLLAYFKSKKNKNP